MGSDIMQCFHFNRQRPLRKSAKHPKQTEKRGSSRREVTKSAIRWHRSQGTSPFKSSMAQI
jgi:hypothetical protein